MNLKYPICRLTKRRLAITNALLLIAAFFSITGCERKSRYSTVPALASAVPADFVAHTSTDGSMTIKTPPSWEPGKLDDKDNILDVVDDSAILELGVVRITVPADTSMEDALDQLRSASFPSMKTRTIVRSELTQIDGHPAARNEIAGTAANGTRLTLIQEFVMSGTSSYIITTSAATDDLPKNRKVLDQIRGSIKIK